MMNMDAYDHEIASAVSNLEAVAADGQRRIAQILPGILEVTVGAGLGAIGVQGIDDHEARTSEDGITSITLDKPEVEVHIVPVDVGFGLLAAGGIALAAHGTQRLCRALSR